MSELTYVVHVGADVGLTLTPHVHKDEHYVVSRTRFVKDYVRVPVGESLLPWVQKGYSVRMSAPGRSPSLINPWSICVAVRPAE